MHITITCELERAMLVRVLRSYADESMYVANPSGRSKSYLIPEHGALPRLYLEAALLRRIANEIEAAEL